MVNRFVACAVVVALAGCATGPAPAPVTATYEELNQPRNLAYDAAGRLWYLESSATACVLRQVGSESEQTVVIATIPRSECEKTRLLSLEKGLALATASETLWISPEGSLTRTRESVLAAINRDHWIGRQTLTRNGKSVSIPFELKDPVALERRGMFAGIVTESGQQSLVIFSDATDVKTMFKAPSIESFDISPDELEAVVAAENNGNLDVAIVSLEVPDKFKWVAPTPMNERLVSWAPRGNKIAYLAKAFGGATLRTIHVPTAYQVLAEFTGSDIAAMVWEPKAEHYAAITSSPVSSPAIESIRYAGERRQLIVAPAKRLDLTFEEQMIGGAHSVLLSPKQMRYSEKLPLVVVTTSTSPLAWNALAARIAEKNRVAILVTAATEIDKRFWSDVQPTSWLDLERVWVIDESGRVNRDVELQGAVLLQPGGGVPNAKAAPDFGAAAVARIERELARKK